MLTFALCWYALGWGTVGYACRFHLNYLNTCQLFGLMVLAPLAEMFGALVLAVLVVWAVNDPLYAAGKAILAVSYVAGGFLCLAGLEWLIDEADDFCRIIWRKP